MKFHYFTLLLISLSTSGIAQQLTGRVLHAETLEPLPDVFVWLDQLEFGNITDQHGYFYISELGTNRTLKASAIGFEKYYQELSNLQDSLKILLKPTVITLNNEIVVTPGRQRDELFEIPDALSVVSSADLNQTNPRTTPEALFGTSGVWVQKTNHGGGSPFVRGLTGHQTLIMIDGIRLNNATFRSGPNQYLNTVDPFILDRIEVLRGGGSVQYGTDALGGVVNLISREPRFSFSGFKAGGNATMRYITRNMDRTGRIRVDLSGSRIALSGGVTGNDFGDLIAGGNRKLAPSGYRQFSTDWKAKLRANDRLIFTVAYQFLQQQDVPVFHKVQLENFLINAFDPQKRKLAYFKTELTDSSPWIRETSFTISRQESEEGRISRKNGSVIERKEEDITRSTGLIFNLKSQPAEFWNIRTGLDFYLDQVNSIRSEIDLETNNQLNFRGLYPDDSQLINYGLYSLHSVDLKSIRVDAGIRFNGFNITVEDTTLGRSVIKPETLVGNLALLYRLNKEHRLVAAIQSGFRAPNIDDLGSLGIVDFRYEQPAFDLESEQSINYQLGYKLATGNLSGSFFIFQNQLTSLITRSRLNDSIQGYPVYQKINSGNSYIRGLEAEVQYQLMENLRLEGNLTWLFGENVLAAEPMRRIPPLNGRFAFYYEASNNWWFRAELIFASLQDRLAAGDIDDNRIPAGGTPGWNLFNLYGGYSWKMMKINLAFNNITDEFYRIHGSGVDGMGRNLQVSLSFDF
jgi:iron complex outermembrane receptor protein/hemoglobin/transferrin/lactoferrin receptor protein